MHEQLRDLGVKTTRRLFFALWPDAETRSRLAEIPGPLPRTAGRRVIPYNLHITLVFLGGIDTSVRLRLEQMADAVTGAGFRLHLDVCGFWPKPRVAWLGARHLPQALVNLQCALAAGAQRCGIGIDARPYSPHVTLVRDARRPLLADPVVPVVWEVCDFVLMQSQTRPAGVDYEVLRSWALTGVRNTAISD